VKALEARSRGERENYPEGCLRLHFTAKIAREDRKKKG